MLKPITWQTSRYADHAVMEIDGVKRSVGTTYYDSCMSKSDKSENRYVGKFEVLGVSHTVRGTSLEDVQAKFVVALTAAIRRILA
jgi:hypothetical protein